MSTFQSYFNTYEDFLRVIFMRNINSDNREYDYQVEENEDIDEEYIKYFLSNGLNPQKGLELLIDAFWKNSGYYFEEGYPQSLIQLFLDAGAVLTPLTSVLFQIPNNPAKKKEQIEKDCGNILIVSDIISTFWDLLDQEYIRSITNWDTIIPSDWEDIEHVEVPLAYLQYYKYCIKQLQ